MSLKGTNDFLLSIAGVIGHLRLDAPSSLASELRDRYGDFLLPPAGWIKRDFTLDLSRDGSGSPPPGDLTPEVHADPGSIALRRWDFEASCKSRVGGPWTGSGRIRANVYSIDSFLRVLWSFFLARAGGGLFHACGLRSREAGFLFPGVSGAGKTTLARKAPSLEDVFSDEVVPVRRVKEGDWRIYSSPFWGEFGKGYGSLVSYPLAGVGFLRKADHPGVLPIPTGDAAARLLATLLHFDLEPRTAGRTLDFVSKLASEVPVFEASSALATPPSELLEKMAPRPLEPCPRTARGAVSELRARLRRGESHAIVARGTSMRPWIPSGDTLIIRPLGEGRPSVGDVVATWLPGETEDKDRLVCHRLVAGGRSTRVLTKGDALGSIDRIRDGREAQILGVVLAISREGETRPIRGGVRKLAQALVSVVAAPVVQRGGL